MVSTPQLSVGLAAKVTLAEQAMASLLTAMAAGGLTVGSVLSLTVTLKLLLALLPWMSVTVTSTVWLPTAKTCGEVTTIGSASCRKGCRSQLSVGVAAKLTLAEQALASLLTAMAAGGLTVGGVLSVTF